MASVWSTCGLHQILDPHHLRHAALTLKVMQIASHPHVVYSLHHEVIVGAHSQLGDFWHWLQLLAARSFRDLGTIDPLGC